MVLHFAEMVRRLRSSRRFEIHVQQRTWTTRFEPMEKGLRAAHRIEREIDVDSGFLDISLRRRSGVPVISAIEIIPVRGR